MIIDPAVDYEPSSGAVDNKEVVGLLAFVKEKGYSVERIVETHVHADHLTGAQVWKKVSSSSSRRRPLPLLLLPLLGSDSSWLVDLFAARQTFSTLMHRKTSHSSSGNPRSDLRHPLRFPFTRVRPSPRRRRDLPARFPDSDRQASPWSHSRLHRDPNRGLRVRWRLDLPVRRVFLPFPPSSFASSSSSR